MKPETERILREMWETTPPTPPIKPEPESETMTLDRARLLDLFYAIGEREDDPENLSLEYLYGARDIIGWIWAGMHNPDDNMAATNSRLFELLEGLR